MMAAGDIYMVRIKLSTLLGERRMTQAELARKTGIRPATINEMYHEFIERINSSILIKYAACSAAIFQICCSMSPTRRPKI